jgi:phytoene desaturase
MSKRIIIIGAGPGGLASAMLLGRAGFKVTVLERLDRVGGRTSTLTAPAPGDGEFRFDMGPTFFLYPRVIGEIFDACGYDFETEVPMKRLDPQYRLVFEGVGNQDTVKLDCTADVDRMKEQVAQIDPHDAANFERFLSENRQKLEAFRPILESPFLSLGDTMRLPLLKLLPLVRPLRSVDRDLRSYFRDPRTRLAFSFQSKYLGMSPFNCPSLFTILSFLEYEHGVFHPIGGCGAISTKMAELAEQLGVDVRLAEEVKRIDFDGRRARSVVTDQGEYKCDALVINADFAHAMSQLVPDHLRSRWTDRKLAKKRYSCSTFMMYLGIEGRYDDLPHHTIHLTHDYKQNLADIEDRHQLSESPSFYVQNASVTDPTLAPEGHSTLYCLIPCTHMHPNVDWQQHQQRYRDLFIQQMAKIGYTDVEDRIRYERIITPADWQDEMAIYRGATFNLAHSLTQMLHLRPRNRFEDLEGVYLTGGGTHPGSGLPVIYESARITSRIMMRDFAMDDTWVPGAEDDRNSSAQPALAAARVMN